MKKVTVFMAFCVFAMVACPQVGEAQSTTEPQEFYSLEMYYAPSQYIYNGSDLTVKDEEPFKQTGLGISINKPLSKTIHLYLNYGVGFVFANYKHEEKVDFPDPSGKVHPNMKTSTEYLYFSGIYKVNVGYLIRIPSTTIAFFPYVGAYARAHIGGKCYLEYPSVDMEKRQIYQAKTDFSLFTESNQNDNPWNRFELGGNIGVKAYFGAFMVGVTYGTTFNDLTDDTRVTETRLSAGFRF